MRTPSALLAGSRFFHLANMKGHVRYASFEAVTDDSGVWEDRRTSASAFRKTAKADSKARLGVSKGKGIEIQWEILPRLRSSKPLETKASVESSDVGSGTATTAALATRKP